MLNQIAAQNKARQRPAKVAYKNPRPIAWLARGIIFAIGLGALRAVAAEGIEIEDAWARESPPTVQNAAVYLIISDQDGKGDRLVGAFTDRAERAEIHLSEMKTDEAADPKKEGDHGEQQHEGMDKKATVGMMTMREIEGIDIPADGQVRLQPAGLHIMLFSLSSPLKAGETFTVTLEFENSGSVPIDVSVVKPGA